MHNDHDVSTVKTETKFFLINTRIVQNTTKNHQDRFIAKLPFQQTPNTPGVRSRTAFAEKPGIESYESVGT